MSAPEPRSVVVERALSHPPEKVWRALTQGPLLEDWLMANDFAPVVGHRFTFRAAPNPRWDGVIDCEVLEVEPPTRLAYSWCGGGDPATTVDTVVTWTVTPTAGGAHVRMEQTGFGGDQVRNYQGALYGWNRFLDGLVRVVDEA